MTDSDGILAGPTERTGPRGSVGRGLWVGVCLQTTPTPSLPMARRKSRMFKELALVKSENIGHTGSSNNIAKLLKQSAQFTSAYIDKVRISYHYDFSDTFGPDQPADLIGSTFYVTTSNTASPASTNVISATGTRGAGGTVTLDVKRRIVDNDFDDDSGNHALCVWVQTTDVDMPAGDVTGNFVLEVWGRWHSIESL